MIQGIDHIGIAVRSLDERIPFYRDVLALGEPEIEVVAEQKVRVAMFRTGAGRLELLEPTGPDSPIAKFIEKNGEGIHHLALGTDDIGGSIAAVEGAGLRMIDSTPREGAEGAQIAFVHPKSSGGVLLEFCRRL
jgi:methylmalonyl-CoA/ethylmalonyl-CoA epimerase